MALTPLRWVAAAIAGCLAAAVLVLRPDAPKDPPTDQAWQLRQELDRHGTHASYAARQLRLVTLFDSLGAAGAIGDTAGPTGRLPTVRVRRDPALPAELADTLASLARRAARTVRDSAGTGTDIVFVYDTLSQLRGAALRHLGTMVEYRLPRTRADRCVALVRVGASATTTRQLLGVLSTTAAAEQLLGPCAYYQAFGLPGREVDRWLRARGWAFVGSGSWDRGARRTALAESGPLKGRSLERAVFGQTTLPFLYEMQLEGTQCAAGETDACARAMLAPSPRRFPATFDARILMSAFPLLDADVEWYPPRAFGRHETSLLAAMVRTLGHERFARFWSSSEQVPRAFEQAAGEPLERWASAWAESTYGAMPARGPRVGGGSAVVALAMVAAAFALALVVSGRRQFG